MYLCVTYAHMYVSVYICCISAFDWPVISNIPIDSAPLLHDFICEKGQKGHFMQSNMKSPRIYQDMVKSRETRELHQAVILRFCQTVVSYMGVSVQTGGVRST